jgi:hypothetical protein
MGTGAELAGPPIICMFIMLVTAGSDGGMILAQLWSCETRLHYATGVMVAYIDPSRSANSGIDGR